MINIDDVFKENIKEHKPNWPQIPDHPYRILIIGGSWSGKTNSFLILICHQPDIDKFIYILKIHMEKISIFNWQTRKYWLKSF